jgi:hypothetical protein
MASSFLLSLSPEERQTSPIQYTYETLPPTEQPIRLLYLDRELTPEGNFRGEIRTFDDLTKAPEYRAISYVWGEPTLSCRIETSKGYVSITQSLADALRAFRKIDGWLIFWADAVCINQEGAQEKGRLVAQMRDVFRTAHSVLAYVGHVTAADARLIAELCESFDRAMNSLEDADEKYIDPTKHEQYALLPASHPAWEAYRRVIHKTPWIRR